MKPENRESREKKMRSKRVQGWTAIIVGLALLIMLPPLNKIFFGQLWFEDTTEKQLLNITLIVIGWLLLEQANLMKKLNELETRKIPSPDKNAGNFIEP